MVGLLEPDHEQKAFTATVAKWFNNIGSDGEVVSVLGVYGWITTVGSGETITFEDEDGSNDFLIIDCTTKGAFSFTFAGDGIILPPGKDIKVTHSASTAEATINIVIGRRT